MRLRRGIAGFVAVIQSVLFLVHFFLYQTWIHSAGPGTDSLVARTVFALLSISFVSASLLAFRYTNPLVRAFYRVAAIWLGLLTFVFAAGVISWMVLAVASIAGWHLNFHAMVVWLFAGASVIGIAGVINASWTRISRINVRLANLPEAWRGRKAALISDLHLGHVRNGNFLRRMIAKISNEDPDAIFIAGDLFDGTAIDAGSAAQPLNQLKARHGVYFVAGNHEQFGDDSKYLNAVRAAGVRVLNGEKVEADGLQIAGVPYDHATRGEHLASALKKIGLDRDRASILLVHAPDHPAVAEAAGVSLQLSGHTHRGQFVPWSWFARKMYRQFVYGLSRIGKMQVFTSSGAGTWGPPLRLGSNPEIVVLRFE
ncbi:MAG: metallophosphoesterase [Candidatus Sulfotelmatobacter sp.]|jgi:predicted MPP superfamily phosphohydrolase